MTSRSAAIRLVALLALAAGVLSLAACPRTPVVGPTPATLTQSAVVGEALPQDGAGLSVAVIDPSGYPGHSEHASLMLGLIKTRVPAARVEFFWDADDPAGCMWDAAEWGAQAVVPLLTYVPPGLPRHDIAAKWYQTIATLKWNGVVVFVPVGNDPELPTLFPATVADVFAVGLPNDGKVKDLAAPSVGLSCGAACEAAAEYLLWLQREGLRKYPDAGQRWKGYHRHLVTR